MGICCLTRFLSKPVLPTLSQFRKTLRPPSPWSPRSESGAVFWIPFALCFMCDLQQAPRPRQRLLDCDSRCPMIPRSSSFQKCFRIEETERVHIRASRRGPGKPHEGDGDGGPQGHRSGTGGPVGRVKQHTSKKSRGQ